MIFFAQNLVQKSKHKQIHIQKHFQKWDMRLKVLEEVPGGPWEAYKGPWGLPFCVSVRQSSGVSFLSPSGASVSPPSSVVEAVSHLQLMATQVCALTGKHTFHVNSCGPGQVETWSLRTMWDFQLVSVFLLRHSKLTFNQTSTHLHCDAFKNIPGLLEKGYECRGHVIFRTQNKRLSRLRLFLLWAYMWLIMWLLTLIITSNNEFWVNSHVGLYIKSLTRFFRTDSLVY